jgi:hypothetical protein
LVLSLPRICTNLLFSWVVKDFILRPISSTPEVSLLCNACSFSLLGGNSSNLLLKSCYVYLFRLILQHACWKAEPLFFLLIYWCSC